MNAPTDPADLAVEPAAEVDMAAITMPMLAASRRGDGWSGDRQRAFCEAVAEGHTVANACRMLGLSVTSAYAFRASARGAAFAIGWSAAQMLQRHRLADILAERAIEGQRVTVTRADGSEVERHFYDNRLSMAVLARLDRLAAGSAPGAADTAPAAAAETHAARLAAGEFDRFLDLLAADAAPARAGMFLALRGGDAPGSAELAAIARLGRADLYVRTGAGMVAEIDTSDLDVAARATWTAAQWARAEAAGLLALAAPAAADDELQHSQHSPAAPEAAPLRVWTVDDGWRTDFPPPPGFFGDETGSYGDADYERDLSDEEIALQLAHDDAERARWASEDEPARRAWLAGLMAGVSAPGSTPAGGDAPPS